MGTFGWGGGGEKVLKPENRHTIAVFEKARKRKEIQKQTNTPNKLRGGMQEKRGKGFTNGRKGLIITRRRKDPGREAYEKKGRG